MVSKYEAGRRDGTSSAMPAVINLLKRIGEAKADSAEWKEQHENLLAMYRTSEDSNTQLRAALSDAKRDAERFKDGFIVLAAFAMTQGFFGNGTPEHERALAFLEACPPREGVTVGSAIDTALAANGAGT